MKIGVTGASGQLGRIAISKLNDKVGAENVIGLVRSPQKVSDLGIEVREFDYNKPELLATALQGIDKLFLISGSEMGNRVKQHANVIEAAKSAGVGLIVYTSLLKTDSSTMGLADEHSETEKLLKASGIPYVILRNGWYIENYTVSIPDIIKQGALYGCSGDGKISAATREDYAEAAATVLTTQGHENKIYELAGDEAFTLAQFAAELSSRTGNKIAYVNIPENDYAQALVQAGLPEALALMLADSQTATQNGDLFDNQHQMSKLIGRSTTPMAKVVADTLK